MGFDFIPWSQHQLGSYQVYQEVICKQPAKLGLTQKIKRWVKAFSQARRGGRQRGMMSCILVFVTMVTSEQKRGRGLFSCCVCEVIALTQGLSSLTHINCHSSNPPASLCVSSVTSCTLVPATAQLGSVYSVCFHLNHCAVTAACLVFERAVLKKKQQQNNVFKYLPRFSLL